MRYEENGSFGYRNRKFQRIDRALDAPGHAKNTGNTTDRKYCLAVRGHTTSSENILATPGTYYGYSTAASMML